MELQVELPDANRSNDKVKQSAALPKPKGEQSVKEIITSLGNLENYLASGIQENRRLQLGSSRDSSLSGKLDYETENEKMRSRFIGVKETREVIENGESFASSLTNARDKRAAEAAVTFLAARARECFLERSNLEQLTPLESKVLRGAIKIVKELKN